MSGMFSASASSRFSVPRRIFTSNFEQYYLFTNVVNQGTMEVFDVYIYRYGLKLFDYSYATAVGVVKGCANILVLVAANQIAKRATGQALF